MKTKLILSGALALLTSCANDFNSAAIPPTPFSIKTRDFAFSGQLGGQKKAPQRTYASNSSSYSAPKTTRPKSSGSSAPMSANEQFALGFFNAMVFGDSGSSGGSGSASGYQNGEEGWAAAKGR